ncbi:MAG: hypothetical protein RLZZ215_2944 [Pseudomonadota bacterium]
MLSPFGAIVARHLAPNNAEFSSNSEVRMPYYVFRITQTTPLLKKLEYQGSHEAYQEARQQVRSLRSHALPSDQALYKLIFAANQLEAEERLHEQREQPILMEWEK